MLFGLSGCWCERSHAYLPLIDDYRCRYIVTLLSLHCYFTHSQSMLYAEASHLSSQSIYAGASSFSLPMIANSYQTYFTAAITVTFARTLSCHCLRRISLTLSYLFMRFHIWLPHADWVRMFIATRSQPDDDAISCLLSILIATGPRTNWYSTISGIYQVSFHWIVSDFIFNFSY